MKRWSFAFAMVVMALLLMAVGAPLRAQTTDVARQKLEAAAVGPVEVTVSAETGLPSFIRGTFTLPGPPLNPTAAASAFLARHAAVFGIADPAAELALLRSETDALGMSRVLWQQVVNGVPVHNAQVSVHLAAGGAAVVAATSGYVPGLYVPTTQARFTARQALANALPAMPNGVVDAGPTLVIYPFNDGLSPQLQGRVSWIIEMRDDTIPARNLYVVDAQTGHLIEAVDLLTGAAARPAAPTANDPDDGRTLRSEQPLSGDISPVGDVDTYVFVGLAGQVVTLHMSQNAFTATLDPYLSLYGADGLLATDNDSGPGDDATIRRFTLSATGTYTVRATSLNNEESGLYTITLISCSAGQFFAEYFDNRYLEGEPILDRCEPMPISYDWGSGAPEGLTQHDNFSIRWTGRFAFLTDTYTFAGYVDDGLIVELNGAPILEAWYDHSLHYHSADVAVTAGAHDVEVQYYDRSGGAAVNVRWFGQNSDPDDGRVLAQRNRLSGDITPAGDADLYYFDAEAGDLANVSMRENSFTSSLDPYLVVLHPNGTVLAADNDSGEGDAAAISQLELPVTGRYSVRATDNAAAHSGLYSIEFWLTGLYRQTYDAEHGTSLPGQLAREEGQGAVGDRDTDQAHDFAGRVYTYYADNHSRLSYDGLGAPLISTVHYGLDYNNAFWNGQQMTYGDGTAVLDVIGHELTHGVVETTANLKYEFQSGAMNESYADIFGAMIDRDDWLMGEDLPPDMLGGREAIRDLANPERFGHPAHTVDWVSTCDDNLGVHTNSGIYNKAYYNIATAMGKFKAERIFYRALVTYLGSSSGFRDGRAASIQAAIDLYGDGIEKRQVEQGFDDVGISASWNVGRPSCGGCAVTQVTADRGLFADAITGLRTVTTLYRVRDTLLDTTARGRHYRDLYEQHTGSITRILAADRDLRGRGANLLAATQPALNGLADGQGDTVINAALVRDVRAYLTDLAAAAETRGDTNLAHTIRNEMTLIQWNKLVGLTYDQAWELLNLPQVTFVPMSAGR